MKNRGYEEGDFHPPLHNEKILEPEGHSEFYAVFAEFRLKRRRQAHYSSTVFSNSFLESVSVTGVEGEFLRKFISESNRHMLSHDRREPDDPECFIIVTRDLCVLDMNCIIRVTRCEVKGAVPTVMSLNRIVPIVISGSQSELLCRLELSADRHYPLILPVKI